MSVAVAIDLEALGQRIRLAVEGSGKKLASIARETGITESYLQRLMAGMSEPGAERIALIADATGFSADYLLLRTPRNESAGRTDEAAVVSDDSALLGRLFTAIEREDDRAADALLRLARHAGSAPGRAAIRATADSLDAALGGPRGARRGPGSRGNKTAGGGGR